jgi:S1-C subfamily serine protease
MNTTPPRKIHFYANDVWAGSGRVSGGRVCDCPINWSDDLDVAVNVFEQLDAAIEKGCSTVAYVNDSGERVAITWKIEQ